MNSLSHNMIINFVIIESDLLLHNSYFFIPSWIKKNVQISMTSSKADHNHLTIAIHILKNPIILVLLAN